MPPKRILTFLEDCLLTTRILQNLCFTNAHSNDRLVPVLYVPAFITAINSNALYKQIQNINAFLKSLMIETSNGF